MGYGRKALILIIAVMKLIAPKMPEETPARCKEKMKGLRRPRWESVPC